MTVLIEELTREAAKRAYEAGATVILPTGSIEQHGAHVGVGEAVVVRFGLREIHEALGQVEGAARALDANTLVVGSVLVRLDGIDAPELGQTCRVDGRVYACGEVALGMLMDLVMGKRIACTLRRIEGDDRDFGICREAGAGAGDGLLRHRGGHSTLIFASRRIFAHLSISARIRRPKSSGARRKMRKPRQMMTK